MEHAFEQFASRVAPALLRTAFLLSGDHGAAEDLLQVTLWRVFQRWGDIRDSPEAYAHRVLVNLSRDRRRSLRRRPVEVPESELPDGRTAAGVERLLEGDTMTTAVRRLPRRQREVVVMRFFLDLSIAETAAALGTQEGTVKAYSARALARMRELIEADDLQAPRGSIGVPHAD